MTEGTVLTDEEIVSIGQQARAIEPGEKGYILPIAFARAIEQAVLQATAEYVADKPIPLCDCELGHNGMGRAGRECDCPAGIDRARRNEGGS